MGPYVTRGFTGTDSYHVYESPEVYVSLSWDGDLCSY